MSAKTFNIAIVVFSLVLVWTCSGQPSLGETQRGQVLQQGMEALASDNTTNITSWGNVLATSENETVLGISGNETVLTTSGNETTVATDIRNILRAAIETLSSRGLDVGLEANSEGEEGAVFDSLDVSDISERVYISETGEVRNSSESDRNVTSDLVSTQNPTSLSSTSGLPESTVNRRSSEPDASSTPHQPDLEVSDSTPSHPDAAPPPGEGEEPGQDTNPKVEHVEEPVEASTDGEGDGSGNLPLVLGVCIVVIFVGGVTGAAISSWCRRRKMAAKDTVSESSSNSEIELERGLDNPVFSKSTSNLTLVASAFPPNSRLYKEMRYASPTMPLY
ncbi:uncharacterized protein LOC135468714 [Liolophura sinensis]|uniref:uncharacterized protein LOC135468714 n=1 Tax=Liolophura sinensis TaxID=3198878 RepID=UPI003158BCF2